MCEMKKSFKPRYAVGFRIILLIATGLTFTILKSAVADSTETLWKIRVKGFSSTNGNAFLETAEYLGPTTSFTNLQVNELNPSYDSGLPARLMLHTGFHRIRGTKFVAGYYRGIMVASPTDFVKIPKEARTWNTNLVSVFCSQDLTKLFIAVDNGPIYSSTNIGVSWNVINTPGKHEFPLDTNSDGSGFYIEVSLKASSIDKNNMAKNWYVVASVKDGNTLVVTESAPILSIGSANGSAVISWTSQGTFVLQQNSDLTTTNWTDVSIVPILTNGLNQVIVSPVIGNQFYRLRKASP